MVLETNMEEVGLPIMYVVTYLLNVEFNIQTRKYKNIIR